MNNFIYSINRILGKILIKIFYRVKIVNKNNIPKNGPFILAGNHKSNYDCVMLMSSTNKKIRFLAKKELLESKIGFFFRLMGIIPVDRSRKNKEALNEAYNVLNNKGVIGIFPEGTFNKTEYIVKPFKFGAVKMAMETNAKIIPFAIIGEYKLFRKGVKIVFGKPYKISSDDIKIENNILMNNVIDLLNK